MGDAETTRGLRAGEPHTLLRESEPQKTATVYAFPLDLREMKEGNDPLERIVAFRKRGYGGPHLRW